MAKTKILRTLIFSLSLIFFLLPAECWCADFEDYYLSEDTGITPAPEIVPEQVILNADRVSFNDETGYATAEGNAALKYKDMTIEAERIEYNADTQKVTAMPLPEQKVKIQYTNQGTNRILRGDILDYDLNSGE